MESNWTSLSTVLGGTLIALVVSLITGRTLKYLIYLVLDSIAKDTNTEKDDKIVDRIQEDWQIPEEKDTDASVREK